MDNLIFHDVGDVLVRSNADWSMAQTQRLVAVFALVCGPGRFAQWVPANGDESLGSQGMSNLS